MDVKKSKNMETKKNNHQVPNDRQSNDGKGQFQDVDWETQNNRQFTNNIQFQNNEQFQDYKNKKTKKTVGQIGSLITIINTLLILGGYLISILFSIFWFFLSAGLSILWLVFTIIPGIIIIPISFFSLFYNIKYYKSKKNRAVAGVLGIFTGFIVGGILTIMDDTEAFREIEI